MLVDSLISNDGEWRSTWLYKKVSCLKILWLEQCISLW
jgi:hypothetical protein